MKLILTVSTLEKRAMRKKVFENKNHKYQETKTVIYEKLHDSYLLLVRGHQGDQIKDGKMGRSHSTHWIKKSLEVCLKYLKEMTNSKNQLVSQLVSWLVGWLVRQVGRQVGRQFCWLVHQKHYVFNSKVRYLCRSQDQSICVHLSMVSRGQLILDNYSLSSTYLTVVSIFSTFCQK